MYMCIPAEKLTAFFWLFVRWLLWKVCLKLVLNFLCYIPFCAVCPALYFDTISYATSTVIYILTDVFDFQSSSQVQERVMGHREVVGDPREPPGT